jgi:hypothetical protein
VNVYVLVAIFDLYIVTVLVLHLLKYIHRHCLRNSLILICLLVPFYMQIVEGLSCDTYGSYLLHGAAYSLQS